MDYNKQATDFLASCKVEFKAVKAVPQKSPLWAEDGNHGTHWSITLTKDANRKIEFSFWSSIKDKEDALKSSPTAYDVLAGIYTPVDTFKDFCDSYGYDEDSRKAEHTYHEVMALNKKLESIFSEKELQALQEIQ